MSPQIILSIAAVLTVFGGFSGTTGYNCQCRRQFEDNSGSRLNIVFVLWSQADKTNERNFKESDKEEE